MIILKMEKLVLVTARKGATRLRYGRRRATANFTCLVTADTPHLVEET